jgi:hypothetical protein
MVFTATMDSIRKGFKPIFGCEIFNFDMTSYSEDHMEAINRISFRFPTLNMHQVLTMLAYLKGREFTPVYFSFSLYKLYYYLFGRDQMFWIIEITVICN